MRATQLEKLTEIKKLLWKKNETLLEVSAEVWEDDEAEDDQIPQRIESAAAQVVEAYNALKLIIDDYEE